MSKDVNKKDDKTKSDDNKFKKTCFVMMPISKQPGYDDDNDHFTKVYEQIFSPAIIKAGFIPHRVDENKISDSIINKIFDAIQKCPMALCDLSARNPNVLYELGLRQAYDLPVVLVKDEKTDTIFDVSGINTVEYNSHRLVENVNRAIDDIADALKATDEGKETTVVKIVKAQSANFLDVEVSSDDNITIMLNSIMADIRSLKKGQENSLVNKVSLKKDNVAFTIPEKNYSSSHDVFKLKDGVTDREIVRVIDMAQKIYDSKVQYLRNGSDLFLTVDGIGYLSQNFTLEYIRENLERKLVKG
ncbi:MAG: hypothetical protein J1E85_09495 [Ruminococcus sp.]|nr:hypothetical protein [Ruminococcus sp.]